MIVFIIFHFPYLCNFIFGEFLAVILIRVSVLILCDIYESRVVLVTDIVLDCKLIELIEQYFDFLQRRIVFITLINNHLQVCKFQILKYAIIKLFTALIRCYITINSAL